MRRHTLRLYGEVQNQKEQGKEPRSQTPQDRTNEKTNEESGDKCLMTNKN